MESVFQNKDNRTALIKHLQDTLQFIAYCSADIKTYLFPKKSKAMLNKGTVSHENLCFVEMQICFNMT